MSMTYEEAIRRLEAMPKKSEAIEMAIEALKEIAFIRELQLEYKAHDIFIVTDAGNKVYNMMEHFESER